MKTFVADIIPKIQRFSKKLDDLTMLTNQHWVVLDELTNFKKVYIFRQNGELLIVINGEVQKAKWEFLGQNSILIDLNTNSYLFKHGFVDENILALKIDSKDEYVILINENKYDGELNSISQVLKFLNSKYLVNPIVSNKLGMPQTIITDVTYSKEGYSLFLGSYKEFIVKTTSRQFFYIYQKKSNSKYFIKENSEFITFNTKEACLDFIKKTL
jgi:hypothetical protein